MSASLQPVPPTLPDLELLLVAHPDYCFTDVGKTTKAGNGDAVYVWADSSGNGRDFVQATLADRPVLTKTGNVWSVTFSATNKRINGGDLSLAFGADAATLAFRYSQTGDGRCVMTTAAGADGWDRTGGFSYPQYLRETRIETQPVLGEGTHTQVLRSDLSTWTRRYDGTQDISTTALFGSGAVDDWNLGTRHVGEIYCVLATSIVEDAATCLLIEAYLTDLSS